MARKMFCGGWRGEETLPAPMAAEKEWQSKYPGSPGAPKGRKTRKIGKNSKIPCDGNVNVLLLGVVKKP